MDIKKLIYKFPYFVYLNLTEKCNLRCLHCLGSYGFKKENELDLSQWKGVIDQLKDMNIFIINISGGEPTQNTDFKEIIKYIHKKKLHFILTTNGIFSKDVRDFIIKYKRYLMGVKISLDGYDTKTHEFIRKGLKPGIAFNTTMKTINFFKAYNVPMTIASVLHKENIKNLQKFTSFIKKINPISWFISPIVHTGRAEQNKKKFACYECYDINFWQGVKKQNEKMGINIAFEGGEAETLMIDGPIFRKRIKIVKSHIEEESRNVATLMIEKAELVDKILSR